MTEIEKTSGKLQEERQDPTLVTGFLVGILSNGEPHFELIGREKLDKVTLLGLQAYGNENIELLTSDFKSLVKRSLRTVGLGVATIIKNNQPPAEPVSTGGSAHGEESQAGEE